MTFNRKKAKEVADGRFAVTDSIVEYYEREASKMFPDAIEEIDRLTKENRQLKAQTDEKLLKENQELKEIIFQIHSASKLVDTAETEKTVHIRDLRSQVYMLNELIRETPKENVIDLRSLEARKKEVLEELKGLNDVN